MLLTEVEALFALSIYELDAVRESKELVNRGQTKNALVKVHPIIYSRGRRD